MILGMIAIIIASDSACWIKLETARKHAIWISCDLIGTYSALHEKNLTVPVECRMHDLLAASSFRASMQ